MITHSIRALAFYHKNGPSAQRELALQFAGPSGRIATVEDIVNARMHASIHEVPWADNIITSSHFYAGKSKKSVPLLVIAHGNGPTVSEKGKVRLLEFNKMLSGHYGDVTIIDLSSYKNNSKSHEASNRYTYEEALENPIIRGFFGKNAEAYLLHHHNLQQVWLKDEPVSTRKKASLLINRLYYTSPKNLMPDIGVCARSLTLEGAMFFEDCDNANKHIYGFSEFSCATNSGIDDLGGAPYFVVGIRGQEPITSIEPCFRMVTKEVEGNWPHFVQPHADNEPFHILMECGKRLFTQYNDEHQPMSKPHILIDEATLLEKKKLSMPDRVHEMCSVSDKWPFYEHLISIAPQEANALLINSNLRSTVIEVTYYRVTLGDKAFQPFSEILSKFDWQLERRKKAGLLHKAS